jgi:hypothetical protein
MMFRFRRLERTQMFMPWTTIVSWKFDEIICHGGDYLHRWGWGRGRRTLMKWFLKGFWRRCMLYRIIGLTLDSIHRLVCGRQKDHNVSETASVSVLRWIGAGSFCLPHTRQWIESKIRQIILKRFLIYLMRFSQINVSYCGENDKICRKKGSCPILSYIWRYLLMRRLCWSNNSFSIATSGLTNESEYLIPSLSAEKFSSGEWMWEHQSA